MNTNEEDMNASEDCNSKTDPDESSTTCHICERVCSLICSFFDIIGNALETVFNLVNGVINCINNVIKCKSIVYTQKMRLETARELAEIKNALEVDHVLNETFDELEKSQDKSGWFGRFLRVFQISSPDDIKLAKMSDNTGVEPKPEQLTEKDIKTAHLDKPYFNAGVENE